MKITTLILIVGGFNVIAGNSYSQNTVLNLDMQEASIQTVLTAIEDQSEFLFLYSTKMIDVDQKIDIQIDNQRINKVLDQLLEGTDIQYVIDDRNILLFKKNTNTTTTHQQLQVSGKITEALNGEPLAGVTIQVKGTMTGTISQADGTYSLGIPSGSNTLVFSFVGYQTQEIEVAGRSVIDLVMQEEVTALEEIVITGYSVERKKDIIGSVAVVNTEEMLSTPSGNLASQLQGRASGVTISSSGEPGMGSRVRIRGVSSFANSEPLYIIDGTPGSIERVNPNDVASVQILKDAASASIYGARAASGVVIVTTKQGEAGKVRLSIDSYYGMSYVSLSDFPEMCNAQEYGELYWKAMEGAGRQYGDLTWTHPQYGDGPTPVIPEYILVNDNGNRIGGTSLEKLKISDPALFNSYVDPDNYDYETHQIIKSGNTDWLDEVYNPAPIQNHQITVSGGSENSIFLISLNYFDETSVASKYGFNKRYSLRANSNFNITDYIRIGENIQFSYSKSNILGESTSATNGALTYHPLIPIYDIAGNPAGSAAPGTVTVGHGGRNPVTAPAEARFNDIFKYGVFGNAFLDINPLKDLVLRSSFGFDINLAEHNVFLPITFEHYENTTANDLLVTQNNNNSWTWTNTATYDKTINRHTVKLILGTEAVSDIFKTSRSRAYDFEYDLQYEKEFIVLDAATGVRTNSGTYAKYNLFSVFGRIDYSFADKYLINATLRRDGSSRFGINNRYGTFPSVAIGWRISQEPFMQNLIWLTDLKLRASYGIIGNQSGLSPVNQYYTFTGSDRYSYSINGSNIAYPYTAATIGNPDAKWEKTITKNIGIDLSLLQGRITFTGDYYDRLTEDLLVPNQPVYTGSEAVQPAINIGSMRNRGLDFTASTRGVIIGDLQYDVTLGFTQYKNEVLKVLDNDAAAIMYGLYNNTNITRTEKGFPIGYYYGFLLDGFFNTQQEVDEYNSRVTVTRIPPKVGYWKHKDINGDNQITDADRTYMGSAHPDFQVSISLSLNYKNFDLFSTLFWNQGGEIYNSPLGGITLPTGTGNFAKSMFTDCWTPENHDAKLPILDINNQWGAGGGNYVVEDATYIRLKTLQLGYTLPSKWINKIGVDHVRIYVQSQNLFTYKKCIFPDPDAALSPYKEGMLQPGLNIQGSDLVVGVVQGGGANAPTPKQILFGINLSL